MDIKKINDAFSQYIKPQTFPVAIKLCQSDEELPEKSRRPLRDLGYPIALCQATGLSRRYGWTLALGEEDQCCIGGHVTMGFLDDPGQGGITDAEKMHEPGKYHYMVSAPIDRADFEPDIICIYVNSAQAMRLTQAANSGGGGIAPTAATGMGDCSDIIVRTVKTDLCQFILPSGGDRIFGSTQDNELIFTIPKSKIELMMKALEDTHKVGFRYPILTDVRHRPNLPPLLEIPKT